MTKHRCICSMGEECENLSALFFLNNDPRGGYTALPKFHRSLSITSQLWMAWLRSLLPPEDWKDFDQSTSRKRIALHHFRPEIIAFCANGRVCELMPTIDERLVEKLNLNLPEEAKVKDESGNITSEHFVTPSYPIEDAKDDLQKLISGQNNVSKIADNPLPARPQKVEKAETKTHEVQDSLGYELSQPLDISQHNLMEPLVTEDFDELVEFNKKDDIKQEEKKKKKSKEVMTVPTSIIIEIEPSKNRDKLKKKLRDLEATAMDLLPSRRGSRSVKSTRSARSLSTVSLASSAVAPSVTSAPVTKSEISRLEAQRMAYKSFMEQQRRAMEKQKEIQTKVSSSEKKMQVSQIVEEGSDDEDIYVTSEEEKEEESTSVSEEGGDGWEDEDDEDADDEDEDGSEEVNSDSEGISNSETSHRSIGSGEASKSISGHSASKLSPVDVKKAVFDDTILASQQSPCDVKFMFSPPHDLRYDNYPTDSDESCGNPDGQMNSNTNTKVDLRLDCQKQPLERDMRHIFTSSKSLQVFDCDDTSSCPSLNSDNGLDNSDHEPYQNQKRTGVLWSHLVRQQAQLAGDWYDNSGFRAEGPKAFAALSKQKNPSNLPWRYTRHDRFYSNSILEGFVPDRSSPGRILLHIVVRDERGKYVEDLAVGCYHPYAYDLNQVMREDCRVLWTAVRKKIDSWSKIDTLLDSAQYTPLENGMEMKSSDIRAVYGELPPVETVFTSETDFAIQLTDYFESESNYMENENSVLDAVMPSPNMSFALLEMFMRCQAEI
mmetsp:Transcript_14079/g.19778  ORF Transcript_14079/g.19778 Transcript_14079/m.19778 type:complete len:774 (+) Transcript_14079:97-2418(+)